MKPAIQSLVVVLVVLALVVGLPITSFASGDKEPKKTVAASWTDSLPNPVRWSTYGVGSATLPMVLAVGDAIKQKYGIGMRAVGVATGSAGMKLLKDGNTDFQCRTCGEVWAASEGLDIYGEIEWGPQDLYELWGCFMIGGSMALAATEQSGIKSPPDMKGRRIPRVPGYSTGDYNMAAYLAFANLTFEDVKIVEFSSYEASCRAMLEGKIDVSPASGTGTVWHELAASPRGIYWIPFPHDDKAGWARMVAIAPYLVPAMVTGGAGQDPNKLYELADARTPILYRYGTGEQDMVYSMCRAIHETYPIYINTSATMVAWEAKKVIVPAQLVPYHPGAVRYFKEVGLWTDKHEAANNALIERRRILKEMWENTFQEAIDKQIIGKEYARLWFAKREAALKKANLATYVLPE